MKKVILLFITAIVSVTLLASCEKDYSCICLIQNADGSFDEAQTVTADVKLVRSKTRKGADEKCAKWNSSWVNTNNGKILNSVCLSGKY